MTVKMLISCIILFSPFFIRRLDGVKVDVVIALDTRGVDNSQKSDDASAATKEFVKGFAENMSHSPLAQKKEVYISVVQFSDTVRVVIPLQSTSFDAIKNVQINVQQTTGTMSSQEIVSKVRKAAFQTGKRPDVPEFVIILARIADTRDFASWVATARQEAQNMAAPPNAAAIIVVNTYTESYLQDHYYFAVSGSTPSDGKRNEARRQFFSSMGSIAASHVQAFMRSLTTSSTSTSTATSITTSTTTSTEPSSASTSTSPSASPSSSTPTGETSSENGMTTKPGVVDGWQCGVGTGFEKAMRMCAPIWLTIVCTSGFMFAGILIAVCVQKRIYKRRLDAAAKGKFMSAFDNKPPSRGRSHSHSGSGSRKSTDSQPPTASMTSNPESKGRSESEGQMQSTSKDEKSTSSVEGVKKSTSQRACPVKKPPSAGGGIDTKKTVLSSQNDSGGSAPWTVQIPPSITNRNLEELYHYKEHKKGAASKPNKERGGGQKPDSRSFVGASTACKPKKPGRTEISQSKGYRSR